MIPRIWWCDLTPDEAAELDCVQVGRIAYQMFRIEWMGMGIALMVRPKPNARA